MFSNIHNYNGCNTSTIECVQFERHDLDQSVRRIREFVFEICFASSSAIYLQHQFIKFGSVGSKPIHNSWYVNLTFVFNAFMIGWMFNTFIHTFIHFQGTRNTISNKNSVPNSLLSKQPLLSNVLLIFNSFNSILTVSSIIK